MLKFVRLKSLELILVIGYCNCVSKKCQTSPKLKEEVALPEITAIFCFLIGFTEYDPKSTPVSENPVETAVKFRWYLFAMLINFASKSKFLLSFLKIIKVPLSKEVPFAENAFSVNRDTMFCCNKAPKKVASSKLFHLDRYAYAVLSIVFIYVFIFFLFVEFTFVLEAMALIPCA